LTPGGSPVERAQRDPPNLLILSQCTRATLGVYPRLDAGPSRTRTLVWLFDDSAPEAPDQMVYLRMAPWAEGKHKNVLRQWEAGPGAAQTLSPKP